jgi:hypothetical protein
VRPINLQQAEDFIRGVIPTAALNRIRRRWWRLTRPAVTTVWQERADAHQTAPGMLGRQFALLSEITRHRTIPTTYMPLPLSTLPLLVGAREIVELGCAFTYYPAGHSGPWSAPARYSDGMVSTRILLTACSLLRSRGIPATLTSVDIRTSRLIENANRLVAEMGYAELWRPVMGTDSIAWLRDRTEPIDFALVDSNHTYEHVLGELQGLAPLMSPGGMVAVDNAYCVAYPGDGPTGTERGSEFGAILDFLAAHPGWTVEWMPFDMAILVAPRPPAS